MLFFFNFRVIPGVMLRKMAAMRRQRCKSLLYVADTTQRTTVLYALADALDSMLDGDAFVVETMLNLTCYSDFMTMRYFRMHGSSRCPKAVGCWSLGVRLHTARCCEDHASLDPVCALLYLQHLCDGAQHEVVPPIGAY